MKKALSLLLVPLLVCGTLLTQFEATASASKWKQRKAATQQNLRKKKAKTAKKAKQRRSLRLRRGSAPKSSSKPAQNRLAKRVQQSRTSKSTLAKRQRKSTAERRIDSRKGPRTRLGSTRASRRAGTIKKQVLYSIAAVAAVAVTVIALVIPQLSPDARPGLPERPTMNQVDPTPPPLVPDVSSGGPGGSHAREIAVD